MRCPACNHLHDGQYGICDECQKSSRTEQNAEHHPDCPKAWHDKALCVCSLIVGHHYA